jgi:hypothetical protein
MTCKSLVQEEKIPKGAIEMIDDNQRHSRNYHRNIHSHEFAQNHEMNIRTYHALPRLMRDPSGKTSTNNAMNIHASKLLSLSLISILSLMLTSVNPAQAGAIKEELSLDGRVITTYQGYSSATSSKAKDMLVRYDAQFCINYGFPYLQVIAAYDSTANDSRAPYRTGKNFYYDNRIKPGDNLPNMRPNARLYSDIAPSAGDATIPTRPQGLKTIPMNLPSKDIEFTRAPADFRGKRHQLTTIFKCLPSVQYEHNIFYAPKLVRDINSAYGLKK